MDRLFEKPNNLLVLSILRVYVSLHLLKKFIFNFTSFDLLYSHKSIVIHPIHSFITNEKFLFFLSTNYKFFILIEFSLIVFVLFGIFKNYSIFLLYVILQIIQKLGGGYTLNGGDNFLNFILLYLIFCNSFQYFSISKNNNLINDNWISNLLTNIFSKAILIHLCIVYFISGIGKANSEVWYNGTALYYILSLERFQATNYNSYIINNPTLVTLSTYIIMIWELLFVFAITLNNKYKTIFLFFGVLMHLGIYFFMMIHDFSILYIFSYLIFYNDKDILELYNKAVNKSKRFKLKFSF